MQFMESERDQAYERMMQLPPRRRKAEAQFYRGRGHRECFEREEKKLGGGSPKLRAALYLLTADSRLWAAARPVVSKTGIDFAAIRPKDISTEAYVLYRAAQDIYEGTRYIGAAELVDRKLASGRMFRLICRAMELARMNQ